jgi:hypothetical protein
MRGASRRGTCTLPLFIILGVALMLVSFLYTKYRDAIRQLL